MAVNTNWLTSGSWKTAVAAVITAIAGFVEFSPHLFEKWPWVIAIAKYVMLGGLAVMGIAAKDRNVTGGTVINPHNDPTVVKETAEEVLPAPKKK